MRGESSVLVEQLVPAGGLLEDIYMLYLTELRGREVRACPRPRGTPRTTIPHH